MWTAELCVQRVLVTLKASLFPVFMKKTGKHKRDRGKDTSHFRAPCTFRTARLRWCFSNVVPA